MGPREDDEMELINAEFESMVADLNLDQASPKSYLDELEAIEAHERSAVYQIPIVRRGLHGATRNIINAITRWWRKPPHNDEDGAVV